MEKGFLERKDVIEMKRELQIWVRLLVEKDDYTLEAANRASEALCLLNESALNALKRVDVPREYLCPISGEIMKDPTVISSGQTFDRPSIQKWLDDGHQTCPMSKNVLDHMILTPNHLLREIIVQWCKKYAREMPSHVEEIDKGILTNVDQGHLNSLLDKLSSPTSMVQKGAAKEIRQLTQYSASSQALFGEIIDGIEHLLKPLSVGSANKDADLQEDLITTIFNISTLDSNKKLIVESPSVIPLLLESLRYGNIETRKNAAAAIFSLTVLDSNRTIIGELGALKPLIDLLEDGNKMAMKEAASAILNLCTILENSQRAVSEGAVRVIMQKLSDHVLIDELLGILELLCRHDKAIEEMEVLGALSCLLGILREDTNKGNKEYCIAILYTMSCHVDPSNLKEIRDEEDHNGTISRLAQNGTSRAKRKATGILELIKKRYATDPNTF